MTPSAPAPRRPRRRWPFILLAIFIGIPVLSFIALQIAFSINTIPEDKLAPPAELLRETNTVTREFPAPAPATAPTPIPKDYLELVGVAPSDPRALSAVLLENRDIDTMPIIPPRWVQGSPIGEEQRAWLDQNAQLVEAAHTLAAAGGLPPFPREMAAAPDIHLLRAPGYLSYLRFAQILALEARRRYESGDLSGAADLLLAVGPVATSLREPWLFSHIIATAAAEIPTHYITYWIESGDPMPAEIAVRLHTGLLPYPLRIEDTRFVLELEYLSPRARAVNLLNGPFRELVRDRFSSFPLGIEAGWNPYQEDFWGEVKARPGATALATLEALGRAISARARARSIIEEYDEYWRKQLATIESGGNTIEVMETDEATDLEIYTSALFEFTGRIDLAEARHNLILAALARIAKIPDAPLPRDPFTRVPLTVLPQPDDSTTFYSLGPDLADQRGALAYDPTNGTISPGDITLRLPPR